MKWFKRKYRDWVITEFHNVTSESDSVPQIKVPVGLAIPGLNSIRKSNKVGTVMAAGRQTEMSISKNGIRMQIIPAVGGYAVEFTAYDEKTDRHTNHLYVIDDAQDFGEALAKIVNMEMIRG
jgi:hypothetical protein